MKPKIPATPATRIVSPVSKSRIGKVQTLTRPVRETLNTDWPNLSGLWKKLKGF